MGNNIYLNELDGVAKDDVEALRQAEKSYGDSWKKRGGIGAFMMLARKWDRLETRLRRPPCVACAKYDIFDAVKYDDRPEGLIDDIRDLRRYLILVEAELRATGLCPGKLPKDIEEGIASKGGSHNPDGDDTPSRSYMRRIAQDRQVRIPIDQEPVEQDDTPSASVLHDG